HASFALFRYSVRAHSTILHSPPPSKPLAESSPAARPVWNRFHTVMMSLHFGPSAQLQLALPLHAVKDIGQAMYGANLGVTLSNVKQHFEAVFHVKLLVAVKQHQTILRRRKIRRDLPVSLYQHDVLPDSARPGSVHVRKLEARTMKMDRMGVLALVVEDQPVVHASGQLHGCAAVQRAIDAPLLDAIRSRQFLPENQRNGLIRLRRAVAAAEPRIIPIRLGGLDPLRLTAPIGVLDDDSQSAVASPLIQRAEDPDPGTVHCHNRIDSLR